MTRGCDCLQDGKAVVERLKLALGPAGYEAADVSSHIAEAEAVLGLSETWHKQTAEMEIFLRCSCSPP